MIDNQISLDGLFSIVLYAKVDVSKNGTSYKFLTKTDGVSTTKSPDGMFETGEISNDLALVAQKIREYEIAEG